MANLISFMTIIVFLYASIIMAQKFGIQFASAITKGANNFMKWVPGWADRRFLQKTWKIPGTGVGINTSWISPGAWKAGWKTHWDEVNRKKLEQASAAPRDLLSRVFQRGEKHKTYYRDLAFAKLEGEKMKELQSISVESSFLLDQIDRAKKRGGIEGQATASAAMKLIAQQNDEDDYSIDGKNEEHDPLKTKRHILDDLKATGMSEDRAAKIMFQMGHIALPAGNMGYWKMAEFNKKTQNYEVTKDEDQLAGIRAKSQTFETQGLAKILHRDAFMVENAERGVDTEGKPTYKRIFTKVHDVGIEEADLIGGNAAALRQFVQRAKVDTLHAVGGQTGEYDSMKLWTAASERAANKFENAAEKMRQAGRTVEVDANLKRAEEIKHNILRFGEAVVHAYAGRSAREEGATSPESAVNVNKEMLEVMKGIKSELGNLRNR